jgi:hypothetical protein
MGLFRNAMGLFRGRAGENREKAAAELPNEAAAELPDEQTMTVNAQPAVAPREVKREARPNPDEPGWGRTISL